MVVPLALLAALLYALAGAAQQRAASRVLRAPAACCGAQCGARCVWWRMGAVARLRQRARRAVRLAAGLLHSPLWLAGWAADALAFGTQAFAVHVGSLLVVQPLLVTTLLFSLPLAMPGTRLRPRGRDWAGAVAVCAGLALVLSGEHPAATARVHPARVLALGLLLATAAAVLVLAARARPSHGRAVPLAVVAGMAAAMAAALMKLTGDSLTSQGVAATASTWPGYALIPVSAGGLVAEQAAFSVGSLPATMTAITITGPLVSYVLGIGGFGEYPPHGAGIAVAVLGLAALGAGITVLARSPLLAPPGVPPARPGHAAGGRAPAEPVPAGIARYAAAQRVRHLLPAHRQAHPRRPRYIPSPLAGRVRAATTMRSTQMAGPAGRRAGRLRGRTGAPDMNQRLCPRVPRAGPAAGRAGHADAPPHPGRVAGRIEPSPGTADH